MPKSSGCVSASTFLVGTAPLSRVWPLSETQPTAQAAADGEAQPALRGTGREWEVAASSPALWGRVSIFLSDGERASRYISFTISDATANRPSPENSEKTL